MQTSKKFISLVLSGVLVCTMTPFSAVAEESSQTKETSSQTAQNNIDSTKKADEQKNNESKPKKEESSIISKKASVVSGAVRDKISTILGIPLTPDKMLTRISEVGVELFFKHVIDVAFDTNFGSQEDANAKIMRLINEVKEHVNKIEKTTDQTYIRVKQAALEAPLNAFIKDLSRVKNTCSDLSDLYKIAVSIEDQDQRYEAIESFKKENLERLRSLAIDLNTLYDSASIIIQGRGNEDVVSVYDQLMAESYNFANGVPFEQRMQFRNSLISIWLYGALIVSVLDQGSTEGKYATQMNNLYTNGKKLNNLINKTRKLEISQVEKFDDKGMRNVYCYTLGRFVRLTDGNVYSGWSKALRSTYSWCRSFDNNTGSTVGYIDDESDRVVSPFGDKWKINMFSDEAIHAFGSYYATSSQLEGLYRKIPQGSTLKDEFVAHNLITNKDNVQIYDVENKLKAGSMVGSEKFIHNGWDDVHRWFMDLSPVNAGQSASFAKDELVFKADKVKIGSEFGGHYGGTVSTAKDPATLFALEFK